MTEIPRAALFGKLNELAYKSVESATVFCKMRGNPYVELCHWVHQIMQTPNTDLHRITDHFEIDPGRLATDLTAALDALPRGATAISDFSPHLEETVREGWTYSTLLFGESVIRTGFLLVGILKTPGLRNVLLSMSREFGKISVDELSGSFAKIVSGSAEDLLQASDGSRMGGGVQPGEASGAVAPAQLGKQEALARFSVDLTEQARRGEIDPIVGRDDEIRQLIDILMRRRQNNPILTGEAGVGKTAVVEALARKIAEGDVPPPIREVSLRTLDLQLLQAGASMKGEFENRLKQVIEEVQASPSPIILFIDEAHNLIGAGASAGTGDAANLLKPALARGTLRTIAATTWTEYKKYIEKDPALTRRFQVVKVEEPSEEKAILMMRSLASTLENHHRVQILDEALEAAVRLSHRYIPDRQLPDKAVSLLDTASARVAMSQHAIPAELEACRRNLEALKIEMEILDRESVIGLDRESRQTEITRERQEHRSKLAELEDRWSHEQKIVDNLLELRAQLRGEDMNGALSSTSQTDATTITSSVETAEAEIASLEAGVAGDSSSTATITERRTVVLDLSTDERETMLEKLGRLQTELSDIQGESPLIFPEVDEQSVATVVADWTGVPVGRMVQDEIEAILRLADTLEQRVIGQRAALEVIAERIQISRASLVDPKRPIGVFLLVGPSGVGKTETALTLAEAMYGGEHRLITLNMSEFQESHTVSTLKGSPPGYVGYGEGGVLTEAVRRQPYSVVLLDEFEKAHSDVHEIFLQVFDKGMMEDGEGRMIDFKNTIILLTSNVGSELIMNMCKDPDLIPPAEGLAESLRTPLLQAFPAELLGRLITVPYYPLNEELLKSIIRLQLSRIKNRIEEQHSIPVSYDDAVIELISGRCHEVESGARVVDSILTRTFLPQISREFLTRMMNNADLGQVHVTVKDQAFSFEFG